MDQRPRLRPGTREHHVPPRRARALLLAGVVAWLLTRGLVVWLFLGRHAWVTGDLAYFDMSLTALPEAGPARTLVEYPLPGVLVVAVPWLLVEAADAKGAYPETVLTLSLVADAAFTALLAWNAGPRRGAAVTAWLLALPLLGATAYARFDLVPGVLAGAALLLLPARPRVAAAAGALATGLKLWPALVLPALAAPSATRRRVATVVGVVGALLAGVSLAVAGWGRLVSPLTWQAERGLQIESVLATPAMVGWAVAPESYAVEFTEHQAFEVVGPGVPGLLAASEVLSLLLLSGLLVLWSRAFRRGSALEPETVVWTALAAVAGFMVTSKVLSPQYLLWLLPLAAAGLAVAGARSLRVWTALLLAAAAATQLVFPELYGHLTAQGDKTGVAVLALTVRNALLVLLAVWAALLAWRGVSAAGRWSATRPDPRGTSTAPCGGGPTTPR